MISGINLVRSIGQFEDASGSHFPLARVALVYAENGKGKTTLSAIMRSLSTGEPKPILDRRRLGAIQDPEVVLNTGAPPSIFRSGAWNVRDANVAVFDDEFVANNIYSGISIETTQRQNLHELILGAQGVAFGAELSQRAADIEDHNRKLRELGGAIPKASLGRFQVDAFCDLKPEADLDVKVESAEQRLRSAQSAQSIGASPPIPAISLPSVNVESISTLLQSGLQNLQETATEEVRGHLRTLGKKSERWVGEGYALHGSLKANGNNTCPFCAQDLGSSQLLHHYEAYFGAAYNRHKQDVGTFVTAFQKEHGPEALAGFERRVREASERRDFWKQFTNVSSTSFDTAEIARVWKTMWELVGAILDQKRGAPLEQLRLTAEATDAISAYDQARTEVSEKSNELTAANDGVKLAKEVAAHGNIAALDADLKSLVARRDRFRPEIAAACDAYVQERTAKSATEAARDQARTRLEQYRTSVFPQYQESVNDFLGRFNAGFRLEAVAPQNTRAGSSATFNVVVNNHQVDPSAVSGPSFRTVLSSGDRNTLALAFFFASTYLDPQIASKTIVIDDPMTSLDEHRSMHTIQEIKKLVPHVAQVIVLSHSKPFLFELWEAIANTQKSSIQLIRSQNGSVFASWDVSSETRSVYDQQIGAVQAYLRLADPSKARSVAESLRPILERFLRIAYAEEYEPGMMIGVFAQKSRQRLSGGNPILGSNDTAELQALTDFANRFHHDSNPSYQTELINDGQLADMARRTLRFVTKPLN